LIVVSDTSPVLNLARIGRLELLRLLHRQVLIPSAIYRELTDSRSDLPPEQIDKATLIAQPLTVASNVDTRRRVTPNTSKNSL
jgi:predicted nucleic acid-binding protein